MTSLFIRTAMIILVLSAICALTCANFIEQNKAFFDTPKNGGKHWALIVAGSNGWYNYRHQADVCHAYQILHAHGIPDEQIVVMMYDDIAHNSQNPTPGIIINYPNGSDVYHGVPKDYTGDKVTPDMFLKVLQGEKTGGKVIASGPDDHVFVNFVDHGAPGIVAFPNGELTATQLNDAINKMHTENKYSKMVFYVEACESGSMFDNILKTNINVYATTAANPDESSYACYYDSERQTYLGDVYSVMWMQDSDKENLQTETLKEQYEITKKDTNTSHVMEYGDLTMGSLVVGEFQGNTSSISNPRINFESPGDSVRSEDVRLFTLKNQLKDSISEGQASYYSHKIQELVQERIQIDEIFKNIVTKLSPDLGTANRLIAIRATLFNRDCYYAAYNMAKFNCKLLDLPQNDYSLRQLHLLVNLCESGIQPIEIMTAIDSVCNS